MQAMIRLRVFLLCCLFMIGMNVLLIMNGFVADGSTAGETDRVPGCDRSDLPRPFLSERSRRRNLAVAGFQGVWAEKR